jgi:hypothetical protein
VVGVALLAILLIGASAALVLYAVALPRMRSARALDQIHDYGFMTSDRVLLEDAPRPGLIEVFGGIVAPRLGRARLASIRRNMLGAGLHSTSVERYIGLYALSVIVIPLVLIWFALTTSAMASVMPITPMGTPPPMPLPPVSMSGSKPKTAVPPP